MAPHQDALRAQLESEVELAQDVLESARKNFLLDRAESVGMGAEALNIGKFKTWNLTMGFHHLHGSIHQGLPIST